MGRRGSPGSDGPSQVPGLLVDPAPVKLGRGQRKQIQEPPPSQLAIATPPVTVESRKPLSPGTSGTEVEVTENYIRLLMKPGKVVQEYQVVFNPPVDDKVICDQMLNKHVFQNRKQIFDGATLYLPERLPAEAHNLSGVHPVTNESHNITITFSRESSMLLDGTHLFNAMFNCIQDELNLQRLTLGGYFSQKLAIPIPQHRLEVWPGYCTGVQQFDGGIVLKCSASSKVLRTKTVLELIYDLRRLGVGDWKAELIRSLVGRLVMTRQSAKLYRIDDIDFEQTPTSCFKRPDGTQMSYVEYYRQKRGMDVEDKHQPLLVHKPKPTKRQQADMLMLVPELCFLTGLTGPDDFKVMKDVAMYTRVSPMQRMASLRTFIDNIKKNPNCVKLLNEWGLQVPEDTVGLSARTLAPRGTKEEDVNRAVMREQMLDSVDIEKWAVVHTNRDERCASLFNQTLKKIGPQLGVRVADPLVEKIPNDKTDTYLTAIKRCIDSGARLVVIIFPSARDDRSAAVKKLCCLDRPIATQIIISRTISREDKIRPVVQHIGLQMFSKLGGALWGIKLPLKKAMICGLETYEDKAQCVVGFVSSMNHNFTRWHSQVLQMAQLHQQICTAVQTAITSYTKANQCLPDQIIIYRGGVGDGQLNECEQEEVQQVKSAFRQISSDYNPSLIFVVCQKRVNKRIFLPKDGFFQNPHPGTIVDHSVTKKYMSPHWYDFYIVSQFVRQATVTPTHYIVLHNGSSLDADKIQKITYKMCHLYYNWPGTIRVPAPCQYAHKLAHQVACSLHKEPSSALSDTLFYL